MYFKKWFELTVAISKRTFWPPITAFIGCLKFKVFVQILARAENSLQIDSWDRESDWCSEMLHSLLALINNGDRSFFVALL